MNCPRCNNLMTDKYDQQLDILFLTGHIEKQQKKWICGHCNLNLNTNDSIKEIKWGKIKYAVASTNGMPFTRLYLDLEFE